MGSLRSGWVGAGRRLRALVVVAALVAAAYSFSDVQIGPQRLPGKPWLAQAQARDGVRVWEDLRYAGSPKATVDVYRPAQRRKRVPGVLVVHGGAWTHGDKSRMTSVSSRIARAGLIAYSVNYALARRDLPGYPTQLQQLRTAVRWARTRSDRFGLATKRLGAFGTSSGAHLAGLLGTTGKGRLHGGSRVRAVATWSGPLDFRPLLKTRMAGSINAFLGCLDDPCPQRAPAASPITHVSGDDPAMLLVNSDDELVPADQPVAMADRLTASGVPNKVWMLEGSDHAMQYSDVALDRTIGFMRRWLYGRR